MSHFQIDETILEVSTQIDGDGRFDQESFTEIQQESIKTRYLIEKKVIMLCKTVTWNDMKFSKIEDRR